VSEASLLKVENLTKSFGGFVALDNVSVSVAPGERLGLIGPNGSGKTTLINCISGALRAHRIRRPGRDARSGAPARARRHRTQLSDSEALPQHDRARQPAGAARICGP
jgi:ABC-type branched-subunit amino acid transport system ATPase component